MKVLLTAVNAKYIHSNPAVYSLRAYALENLTEKEKKDIRIDVSEYTINQPRDQILQDIYEKQPDILGISCYIWNIETVRALLPELPKILPEMRIFLGGPEVSYNAPELLKEFPFLAGIMIGEGEATFSEVLRAMNSSSGGSLSSIAALCLPGMTDADIRPRPCLSMDDLPFFYAEWGEDPHLGPFAHKILYYETSRGCPFSCSYCLSSVEKSLRFRSLEKVFSELQFFLNRRVPQVKFIDRTFNCKKDHCLPILNYLKTHDNGVTNFHFEIAADLLVPKEIGLLNSLRPGLVQLEIGVQSTNDTTLSSIHRVTDLSVLAANVEKIRKKHNIHQHLDLIAGLPNEDLNSFRKSFNDLMSMRPDQLQLGFLKVLKGTVIEEEAEKYGIVCQDTPPYEVLSTNWLSYRDILLLKGVEEVLELYYNSGQFVHSLTFSLPLFDNAFSFFEKLASWYKDHGLLTQQSSRAYRYEALLRFLTEEFPAYPQIFSELLTYDFLLRERPKKRLSFFPEAVEPTRRELLETAVNEADTMKSSGKKTSLQQIHEEAFYFPVENTEKLQELFERAFKEGAPIRLKLAPHRLLFLYEERDPLSNNAKVISL